MNNYKWLMKNSEKQKELLTIISERISAMHQSAVCSYQSVTDIMNDAAKAAEADVTGWYYHIGAQKFTRI